MLMLLHDTQDPELLLRAPIGAAPQPPQRREPRPAAAGLAHAAQALGRQNSHGQLAAGFVADFAIWDAEHPVEMVYEPGRSPLWHRVVRGEMQ